MKKVSNFYLTKLLVDQHLSFHKEALAQMTNATAESLHITEYYTEYKEIVERLDRARKTQTSLPLTDKLVEIDRDRDYYLRQLFSAARLMLEQPFSFDYSEEAHLGKIILRYRGIQNNQYDKQTEMIRAMIDKIKKTLSQSLIPKFGAADCLKNLEEKNEFFDSTMKRRINEMRLWEKFDRKADRRRANELYRAIIVRVNDYVGAAPTLDITHFAEIMESTVDHYRDVANRVGYGGTNNETPPKELYTED